jgi:hypothetical protein
MELRTEAVDRVLEALSPALTAELERVVEENRQSLEADFQSRLQIAIRDAEENTRITAAAERHQAVENAIQETQQTVREQTTTELQLQFEQRLAEAREAVRRQVSEELQQDFDRKLQDLTTRAEADHSAAKRAQDEWTDERNRMQQQLEQWRVFAEAQRQLNEAGSQPEILVRWLNFAEPFAGSIALYTTRPDGLTLWKSRGETQFPQIISLHNDPESYYFKAVVVRGKTVAAVSAAQPYRTEALDFLTATLERAIELFGLRLRNK